MNKSIDELDRAKIFMPFDALKGLRQALKEKEKIVAKKVDLSQDDIEKISKTLSQLKKRQMVSVTYYDGEDYTKIVGLVSKIDTISQILTVVQTNIKFEDILEISIENA